MAISGGARSGGIKEPLSDSGKFCLSKYDKILLITLASVMQAMFFTLNFSHTSHCVISILNTRFDSPVTGVAPMAYCAHDRVYQNQPDVLLNEGYSFHVVKRLPLLAHGYSGQITRTVPVTGNE